MCINVYLIRLPSDAKPVDHLCFRPRADKFAVVASDKRGTLEIATLPARAGVWIHYHLYALYAHSTTTLGQLGRRATLVTYDLGSKPRNVHLIIFTQKILRAFKIQILQKYLSLIHI